MWIVMLFQTSALLPGKIIMQAEKCSRVHRPHSGLKSVAAGTVWLLLALCILKYDLQRQKNHLYHIIKCWFRSCVT